MTILKAAALSLATLATVAIAVAAARPDGAVIRTSGSTNTAGYQVKLWSNGRAQVLMQGAQPRDFSVDDATTASFFRDVKAARANPGTPGHCMKSASFGTTTTVLWHEWASSDLQCPPFTPAVQALYADVQGVLKAANISGGPRRIHVPVEPRMIPSVAPEVSPT